MKRSYAAALDAATRFQAHFPPDSYVSWTFAGSLRRKKELVGDIEVVVIPAFDEIGVGLFGQTEKVNRLWARLNRLLDDDVISMHVYGKNPNGTPMHRYGDLYRGVDFAGWMLELFTSTPDTLGSTLAIRTGPPELSKALVTGLLRNGRRNKDGQVWKCEPCLCERDERCTMCQGTGLQCIEPIPVANEETFFELAGVPYQTPEQR